MPPWSLRTSTKTPVRQICGDVLFVIRNVRSSLNLKWLERGELGRIHQRCLLFCSYGAGARGHQEVMAQERGSLRRCGLQVAEIPSLRLRASQNLLLLL